LGRVAVTRKPPQFGIVRTCFHLDYSNNSGGFRAFSEFFASMAGSVARS
jgi:hypothetical protein